MSIHAQVGTAETISTPQEQCFQMLKDDMEETNIFSVPLEEIQKITYQDLELNFSRMYTYMSSFGSFELSQPDVEMRLYSFGGQTGYKHPPLSPYPVSTKSETWEDPAKEFILIEEYIKEPNTNIHHFMDCGFIAIQAEDLTQVTRENYVYDIGRVSLKKTTVDDSYKSWYSEILSFNREDKPFVVWRRLFVYPKSTQNEYFNKYDVADAFLAHDVESFNILSFFQQPLIQVQDYDEKGLVTEKTVIKNENGELVEFPVPEELLPIKKEGLNKAFSKSEYYQAIEARFPEFAVLLSFRGSLKYETFKTVASEYQDGEVLEILNALSDYKKTTGLYLQKKDLENNAILVEDLEMDVLFANIGDADTAIREAFEKKERTEIQSNKEEDSTFLKYLIIGLTVFFIGLVFTGVEVWKKHSKKNNQI